MSVSPVSARGGGPRRRKRRGSLERPVNARLYRSSFLLLSLPLLILAFSITRPGPCHPPLLPPNFDGAATLDLANDFSKRFPDRAPAAPGSLAAAQWFRDQMKPLPVSSDAWRRTCRARQRRAAQPVGGRRRTVLGCDRRHGAPGQHRHRAGGERQREAAPLRSSSLRGYAQADTPAGARVRPALHPRLLSTDGGRSARSEPSASPSSCRSIVAVVNLRGIAGPGRHGS
jgi:hypothetical protein